MGRLSIMPQGLPHSRLSRLVPLRDKAAAGGLTAAPRPAHSRLARDGRRLPRAYSHARSNVRIGKKVADVLRQAGRDVLDHAYNHAEPLAEDCPPRVRFG